MGNDEQEAIDVLTEAMRDKAVQVNAAAAFVLWSALESIAKHFDPER